MQVVELTVENFMGLKAAHIEPGTESTVVIGGDNGQGKTSLLDAIECAIRGAKYHPDKPVHEGAERAEINLDLGELKIRRRFKPDGSSTISVENREGFEPKRPQSLLDALAGSIGFDPLAFSRMAPKDRLELVRTLAGVDTSELEDEYASKFEERTDVNREAKRLQAVLDEAKGYPDAPSEMVSIAALVSEMGEAEEANRQVDQAKSEVEATQRDVDHWDAKIIRLSEELEEANGRLAGAKSRNDAAVENFGAMEHVDLSSLREQIESAETINRMVNANDRRENVSADLDAQVKASSEITKRLEEILEDKRKLIESASLPVPGLSFSDSDGVTLDGIPFEQRSAAEKLRASVSIGMALNPRMKVMLVRDGCLLDSGSMELLAQCATDEGYQLFVERVGTSDAGAIIIEAGEVKPLVPHSMNCQ